MSDRVPNDLSEWIGLGRCPAHKGGKMCRHPFGHDGAHRIIVIGEECADPRIPEALKWIDFDESDPDGGDDE